MKNTKKILLCCLCVAAIIAASVLGTLAYLTDRAAVENTFTVGNVDIDLDETDVNEDGTPIPDAPRVDGNEYHLIPGQTYVKDPTVTVVKGSEESYVRMLLTINCKSELDTIFAPGVKLDSIFNGWDSTVWNYYGETEDTAANTVTYEFRYHITVDAYEATEDVVLPALFDSFTLPGTVTGEQLATLTGLTITAEGHAIQKATFDTEAAAWAAFDAQHNA